MSLFRCHLPKGRTRKGELSVPLRAIMQRRLMADVPMNLTYYEKMAILHNRWIYRGELRWHLKFSLILLSTYNPCRQYDKPL
jgi:hypothetical protein